MTKFFIFGKRLHYAIIPCKFEVFLKFPKILNLNRSATRELAWICHFFTNNPLFHLKLKFGGMILESLKLLRS